MNAQTELYRALASLCSRYHNCAGSAMAEHCIEEALRLVKNHMPYGSGFDSGVELLYAGCDSHRLQFRTSFHHMDEHGSYDGWTEHIVTVFPTFNGIDLRVVGEDRDGILDYIADAFHLALNTTIDYQPMPEPKNAVA